MKKAIKTVACAALCAVLLFCLTAPAFASVHTDSHTEVSYGLGVRFTCLSTLGSTSATGRLNLSFENGVAHLPESDYFSRSKVVIYYA